MEKDRLMQLKSNKDLRNLQPLLAILVPEIKSTIRPCSCKSVMHLNESAVQLVARLENHRSTYSKL